MLASLFPVTLRTGLLAMVLAVLPFLAGAQDIGSPQTDLPRVVLQAGMHRIEAQVAATPATRQTGLMHRRNLPRHEGMLFVFDTPAVQCFWMKNTPLPLTAAFLADDGTVVNLADMQPLSTDSHCSAQPVRFVLEMNRGWFADRKLGAGARLQGTPFSAR